MHMGADRCMTIGILSSVTLQTSKFRGEDKKQFQEGGQVFFLPAALFPRNTLRHGTQESTCRAHQTKPKQTKPFKGEAFLGTLPANDGACLRKVCAEVRVCEVLEEGPEALRLLLSL